MSRLVAVLRRWPAGQWALRAGVVAGLLLATVAPAVDGRSPGAPTVVVCAVVALLAGVLPETHTVAAATLLVLVSWLVHDRDGLGAGVLLGAAGLVLAHVAAALAAYVPPRGAPDRGLVLLWLRRGILVLVPAAIAFALVRWVGDGGEELWVAGGIVVVLAAFGTALVMRSARAD